MSRTNEKVSYWRGKHSTIPSDIISGRLLYEQDTGDVFFDYKDYTTGELKRVHITDTSKINKSGGTFTGDVILFRDPTDSSDPLTAVTKNYVDKINQKLEEHTSDKIIHITKDERDSWNNKVDKIPGKGLSTNDFTTALKNKLDGISDNATKVEFESAFKDDENVTDSTKYYDLGYINIDGAKFNMYAPIPNHISGTAEFGDKLANDKLIDGVSFNNAPDNTISHFTICSQKGNVVDKEVSLEGFDTTKSGGIINVYFTEKNTADNPTLKVNSDSQSYPIYYHGAPIEVDKLEVGLYGFVYISEPGISSRYELISGIDTQYSTAISDQPGLLSPEDKSKLDSIEFGANNYILEPATNATLGGVIVGDNIDVDNDGTISISYEGITSALGFMPVSEQALRDLDLMSKLGPFIGATTTENGEGGLVPGPTIGNINSYLRGDGTWSSLTALVEPIPTRQIQGIIGSELGIYDESFYYPELTYYGENLILNGKIYNPNSVDTDRSQYMRGWVNRIGNEILANAIESLKSEFGANIETSVTVEQVLSIVHDDAKALAMGTVTVAIPVNLITTKSTENTLTHTFTEGEVCRVLHQNCSSFDVGVDDSSYSKSSVRSINGYVESNVNPKDPSELFIKVGIQANRLCSGTDYICTGLFTVIWGDNWQPI